MRHHGDKVIAVIPARFGSTRFPGKPLADINGKPMVRWVYERVTRVKCIHKTVVATDDARIASAVAGFGGEAIMTASELASGTDRVAAVADKIPADIYVNIQGDEPLIDPMTVEKTVALVRDKGFPIGTAMRPLKSATDLASISVVKVICDDNGRAIYFSRLPIPFSREPISENFNKGQPACMQHIGIYSYRRETLLKLRDLPVSRLEKAEMLEQLRAIQHGIPIGVVEVEAESIGVAPPVTVQRVAKVLV